MFGLGLEADMALAGEEDLRGEEAPALNPAPEEDLGGGEGGRGLGTGEAGLMNSASSL